MERMHWATGGGTWLLTKHGYGLRVKIKNQDHKHDYRLLVQELFNRNWNDVAWFGLWKRFSLSFSLKPPGQTINPAFMMVFMTGYEWYDYGLILCNFSFVDFIFLSLWKNWNWNEMVVVKVVGCWGWVVVAAIRWDDGYFNLVTLN